MKSAQIHFVQSNVRGNASNYHLVTILHQIFAKEDDEVGPPSAFWRLVFDTESEDIPLEK